MKNLEDILCKVREENAPTQADIQWANKEFFVVDWGKRIPLIARQSGFFAYILKAVT